MRNAVGKDLSQWFVYEPQIPTAALAGVALGRIYPSVLRWHDRHQGRQSACRWSAAWKEWGGVGCSLGYGPRARIASLLISCLRGVDGHRDSKPLLSPMQRHGSETAPQPPPPRARSPSPSSASSPSGPETRSRKRQRTESASSPTAGPNGNLGAAAKSQPPKHQARLRFT